MSTDEWSIHDLASAAGTTSRTLRHYGQLGLLEPARVGANGYRFYGSEALVRLQRILLLRELGLGLPVIAEVLAGEQEPAAALATHLELLRQQRDRIDRQMASVRTTVRKLSKGEPLVADEVFDGFDHTQYKDEVIDRWGKDAYESGDRWWRSMSEADKKEHFQTHVDIAADYGSAHAAGKSPDDPDVQAIVARHRAWLGDGWQGRPVTAEAFTGLGQMYVDDPRFAVNYDKHGDGTAAFVRDAMVIYAQAHLT